MEQKYITNTNRLKESDSKECSDDSTSNSTNSQQGSTSSISELKAKLSTQYSNKIPLHLIKDSPPTKPGSREENKSNGHGTPQQQTGKFGAITNYLNTILGAGIIGIPYAISQSGCITGVLLLIFVAILTDKSLRLIIESAKHHPILRKKEVCTFEDLMGYTFGPYGSLFILWCMFVIAYGSMVAYLLVVKDTIPVILEMLNLDLDIGREYMLILTSITIMLPLSMLKDLASLAFTSFLSIFAAITTVILTIMISPIKENIIDNGGIVEVLKNDSIKPASLFIGLSILSDAFACHHAAYIVYGSLRKPSKRRWGLVTFHSISLAAIVFTIFGLAGYLGYGEDTHANILNNFPMDDVVANVARLLLTLTFFFTYPMEAMVGRHVLFAIMHEEGDLESGVFCCNWRHVMTFTIYVMTLVPALLFDDLGPVLALTGAIGGSCLAYVTPGVLYLGVYGEEFLAYCAELTSHSTTSFQNEKGFINMNDLDVPIAGDGKLDMTKLNKTTKPYWWYILGFPIWTSIASQGRNGLHKKFPRLTYEEVERKSFPPAISMDENVYCNANLCIMESITALEEIVISDDSNDDTIVRPTKYDFGIAIFYILFGFAAMIMGVLDTVLDIFEE